MGQRDQGKTDPPTFTAPPLPSASLQLAPAINATPSSSSAVSSASTKEAMPGPPSGTGDKSVAKQDENCNGGLATTWGRILWEKWRWGLLIALAVVLSRFSSTS